MSNLTKHFTQNLLASICLVVSVLVPIAPAHAQEKARSEDRDRGQRMLRRIKDELKRSYYDPKFRGMDVEARFKAAEGKINEANSLGQILGIIATVLGELEDSHTSFIPPARAVETDYGWTMYVIGERCFVSSVDKGSDAEAKGVKPGDEVLEAGGFTLGRPNLWKFQYLYSVLRPQPGIHVVLRSPTGEQRQLELLAKQTARQNKYLTYDEKSSLRRKAEQEAKARRTRFKSFGDQLLIWQMDDFELTESQVDEVMDQARKHKALILDLRGNPGGFVVAEMRMVSNLFDHDVKIGDSVGRKEATPRIAKALSGDKVFNGRLVILVDSRSMSAAEVLARTIQLEKRGTIIGDRTAGMVMTAKQFIHEVPMGLQTAFYGFTITVSDLIMSDGKSLEKIGVTPDEVRLPTAEDLASGRDTVLSYAASLVGVKVDPVEAGKLFPIVRPKK